MEENGRLSAKQEKAIIALLNEPTIRDAANACKVGETTLYTWLNDPAFSAEYRNVRQRVFEATLSRLQAASGEAVKTLLDVMEHRNAQPAARVAAAKAVLELTLRVRTEFEIEQRLQAIENQLKRGLNHETITTNWKN